jgi:hypothetical protein
VLCWLLNQRAWIFETNVGIDEKMHVSLVGNDDLRHLANWLDMDQEDIVESEDGKTSKLYWPSKGTNPSKRIRIDWDESGKCKIFLF